MPEKIWLTKIEVIFNSCIQKAKTLASIKSLPNFLVLF
jgi:hypothetical protein